MSHRAFKCSGLASLDDLDTPEWRVIFGKLENIQNEFLTLNPHSKEYKWRRDPLHTCNRVWEYPFVYHQFANRWKRQADIQSFAVDLGSGATFFPFAVARLGWDVLAVDHDPESGRSLDAACSSLTTGSGSVKFELGDIRKLTLKGASTDCVYCISVLEHLPDPASVVAEVARIIKPRGLFILTFDVALRHTCEMGPRQHASLRAALDQYFEASDPERFVHPLRVLTTHNSPYPYYPVVLGSARVKRDLKRCLRGLLSGTWLEDDVMAATYGAVLRRRG